MKAAKGADFERSVCTRLSEWWTQDLDVPRSDIFWRSSQSGGRATQRAKSGKTTFGSYGDLAAIDPIGSPLLQLFTIELKRGSSYGSPGDWLEIDLSKSKHPFIACMEQAHSSHKAAGSHSWLMICRRDHKVAVVYLSVKTVRFLHSQADVDLRKLPHVRFCLTGDPFMGLHLEDFLGAVSPAKIIECAKSIP